MSENNNSGELQKKESQPENSEGVLDEYVAGYQQLEIQGYQANIRKARNWLLAAAVLFVVSVFIQVGDVLDLLPIEIKLILFGFPAILVALALLTYKKPVLCLMLALILYIGFYVGMTVWTEEAGWLYGGIIIKVLVIAALLKGLKDAKEAEQLKKEYEMRGGNP